MKESNNSSKEVQIAEVSLPLVRGEVAEGRRGVLDIVNNLPSGPGCYQYLDEAGTVIYVGKAKNLKRRVSSYFRPDLQSVKTRVLVSKIRDLKYVVVNSEEDALLLENNLIKRYKPRYNVLLKDDKTYPSIAITKEWLPRIFPTRNRSARGATYYGPYSHVPTMHALLDLCKKLYQPRPCRTPMSEEGVRAGKYRVCLNYHMGLCKAPCVGRQSREDYLNHIEQIREILRGNTAEVARQLREEMTQLASELRFEEAQDRKVKLEFLKSFQAKSEVVSGVHYNVDVFSIDTEGNVAYINYLHLVEGCVTQAFTFEYRRRLDETPEELLALGIVEMRERWKSTNREIVIPFQVELPENYAQQTIPERGEKRKLLELSQQNVRQYRLDHLKQADKLNPEQKQVRLMTELQKLLGMEHLPIHIELFDNSNISGADAVAACVAFVKMKPAKKLYRTYNIKTVEGPDDYASMKEVVRRRYKETSGNTEGSGSIPDLIIADGGVGQMEVIRQVIEDELGLQIPIAGLAKDNKHRTHELLFGFPPRTVAVPTDSPLFKVLTQMQDEVHRFAITFHRKKRSKRQIASELDSVSGVGEKTKTLLIKHFGSVKRIKEASQESLQEILGPVKGEKIYLSLRESQK